MSYYRRARTAGGTYFFTLATFRRQPILCDEAVRKALREAILSVLQSRPFFIDAWVLLPDHLHCVWTLPAGDADFSTRWSLIKRNVSLAIGEIYRSSDMLSRSRLKHRESSIWQRRYWEHCIRDESDMQRHLDYIHYNPVKHGLVANVADWPHSTFHRFASAGIYPLNWAGSGDELGSVGE